MKKIPSILVIEDDISIRLSAALFLEDCSFNIVQAEDGLQGIEKLKESIPDVILTDIRMPNADGFKVIEEAQKISSDIPIIVMSGTNEINDVIKALRYGVWDFIIKPIAEMSILKHSIEKSIEKANLIKDNQIQKKKLELANKELESFNYSISHDLRGPLHAIQSFSDILEKDCKDILSTRNLDYLKRIRLASKRMNDMIEDLLDLARYSNVKLKKTTVNLNKMTNSIVSHLQKLYVEEVKVTIENDLDFECDERLIFNVLENLIGNAWKYSQYKYKPEIEIGKCDSKFGKAVFVRDNGAGFPMRHYDRLFGVFQRLHSDDEFEGTGVGLATVKKIIQQHEGAIWAESEVGKGATFYFTLPHDE